MTTTLSTKQGLLTKAVKRLAATLENNGDWATGLCSLQPRIMNGKHMIRKTKVILESEIFNVDNALERYTTVADSLEADTPALDEILRKSPCAERTSRSTEKLLEELSSIVSRLQLKRGNIDIFLARINFWANSRRESSAIVSASEGTAAPERYPTKKLLCRSRDSRKLMILYKINYLLDALQASQRNRSNSLKSLEQITSYQKYGNPQALVDHTDTRLYRARAAERTSRDQEKSLEELSSIVSRLQLKGENIDIFLARSTSGQIHGGSSSAMFCERRNSAPER
ncbi:hypothetical protein COOONC_00178 [Cooperia oncophora]